MALSAASVPWSVVYTFRDIDNKEATAQIYLPAGLAYADAMNYVPGIGAYMAALSDCALVSANMSRTFTDAAAEAAGAQNNAQVELKGLFVFRHAQRGTFRVSIPGLKAAVQQTASDKLILSHAAVSGFVDEMLNGLLFPGNAPVTYFGADLVSLEKAVEVGRVRRIAE